MKDNIELILEYLANEFNLEESNVINIGFFGNEYGNEVQIQELNNIPTNYEFDESSKLKDAIKNIIEFYYNEEEKHYLNSNTLNQENHIFNSLKILKELL